MEVVPLDSVASLLETLSNAELNGDLLPLWPQVEANCSLLVNSIAIHNAVFHSNLVLVF